MSNLSRLHQATEAILGTSPPTPRSAPMPPSPEDSWDRHSLLVLNQLEQLTDGQHRVEDRLLQIEARLTALHLTTATELTTLKIKASMWGAAGGLLTAIAGFLTALAMKLLSHAPG